MKRVVVFLLFAVHGAALALALADALVERAPSAGLWRYAAPKLAARAPSAPAATSGALAQCLWPRAVRGDAAALAREYGAHTGIGLAFCLRVPQADPRARAAKARPSYRT